MLDPSFLGQAANWALKPDVTGIVTWLGTAFGAIGLVIVHRQSKSALTKAEYAAQAVRALSAKVAVARVAVAKSQLQAVRDAVSAGDHASAKRMLSALRHSFSQLRRGLAREKLPERHAITTKNLRAVDVQLDRVLAKDSKFKPTILQKALAGLDEIVGDVEADLVTGISDADD